MRSDLFESLHRREIGFFDREENSAGALADQLSVDCRLVSKATGQSASELLEAGFSAVVGLLISTVVSWHISLVVLVLLVVVNLAVTGIAAAFVHK